MRDTANLSGVWAVVPVKRFDRAKSRLANLLDSAEREELAWAMFRDVLDTLGNVPGLSGILVVTNDPRAANFARAHGAITLPDPRDEGTSPAVTCALTWLRKHSAHGAVVVPGDVPFTEPVEIVSVLDKLRTGSVVLVPAVRDGGTNILAMAPPGVIQVAYGQNSFVRHLAVAREAGVEAHVLHLDGAGHDIDVSSDLFVDGGQSPAVRTRAHLRQMARINSTPTTRLCKEISQP
ncbi:2-phospho-L-lactate guanylyltransferase [Ensifer sp. NM-2]|uniref:2-phospho-L-lactate guanylyltransferase n=1 Tax=Ensifer sp. NM-2 TaxID=2109730 RepID=UPI000D1298D6|nr:2-phospho-L-lactate guanylyltransferase [Ensifer sp. NM-2]PSS61923.1 2-phospho-L-lactate guanylyltransferase [Ensifer sp. NM-2]